MAQTAQIIPERLSQITALDSGKHESFADGVCAMEAASYIAGEPWSDHPRCVCPVIATFMRSWNDSLPDAERTSLLLPLIPVTIGTRGSSRLEERRSLMAANWLVRTHIVAWLRLAKLNELADMLLAMPEITSMAQGPSIRAPLHAVIIDAAAASEAVSDAASDAARAAARAAARDAAWYAARAAARDLRQAAAWGDAGAAAATAAQAAAGKALKGTCSELQASAADLIKRMCALTEDDVAGTLAA